MSIQLASCQVLSAALAVIRVHVLLLVPVTRPQANVSRTTTNYNIQTAVDIKCGARSGSPQLLPSDLA